MVVEANDLVKKIHKVQTTVGVRNRTGTKGYLAPETIFKAKIQTRAVDVWAAGVILLSLLAKRHPILTLHASDRVKGFSLQNLVPLVYIFGTKLIKQIAYKYSILQE
jgi:serine/threonine protein kinase